MQDQAMPGNPNNRASPEHNNPTQHAGLFPQDPTGCSPPPPAAPTPTFHTHPPKRAGQYQTGSAVAGRQLTSVSANEHPTTTHRAAQAPHPCFQGKALLRKEVIQPHLPVRLPCYDFVPIASPTFDSSPPYGLGHRLRVLPTFVT